MNRQEFVKFHHPQFSLSLTVIVGGELLQQVKSVEWMVFWDSVVIVYLMLATFVLRMCREF